MLKCSQMRSSGFIRPKAYTRERNCLYGGNIPRKVHMNVLPRMRYHIKSLTEPGDSRSLSFSISLGSLPEGCTDVPVGYNQVLRITALYYLGASYKCRIPGPAPDP